MKSKEELDNFLKNNHQTAASKIIESVLTRISKRISFEDIIQANAALHDQKLPEKYLNYSHKTVANYKENKPTKNPFDVRELDFKFNNQSLENVGAHGTNLSAIISAITNSNSQIIPGIKMRKLGINPSSGESFGTTPLNRKYVSCISLNFTDSKISDAIKYAEKSASNFLTRLKSEKPSLFSDIIPCVVVGEAKARSKKIQQEAGKQDIIFPVDSDIEKEIAFKRLNIRIIAVEDEYKNLVKEILRKLNISDIKICDLIQLNGFLADNQKKDVEGLWEVSEFPNQTSKSLEPKLTEKLTPIFRSKL